MTRQLTAPTRLARSVAAIEATARAPLPLRDRVRAVSEQLLNDPRALSYLRRRAELARISGDNDLRDLGRILDELDASGQLPGDLALLSPVATAELKRLADAVVLLELSNGSPATGFFVAQNLLLTNHHVLQDRYAAAGCRVRLRYARFDSPAIWCTLVPSRMFKTNTRLDYALVAIDCAPAQSFVSLSSLGTVRTNDSVVIVQHPNGGPRQVGIKDNEIRGVDDSHIYYRTDTTPGSSGSPVFDQNMRIVALHHFGGTPGVENGKEVVDNIGVRIELVAAEVQQDLIAFTAAR